MIAIGLMLIMTLQLQIVFGHSRKLYLGADAMAQVYSNARTAFDLVERDVANAIRTDQMEFFNDQRNVTTGVGHFNKGEEISTIQGKFIPGQKYLHAMTFRQFKDYMPKDNIKMGGPYRRDSLYFKSFTTVMGQAREVLIEYRLYLGNDPNDPRQRPVLQRIVTMPKLDPAGVPMYNPTTQEPLYERREPQDICYYVQEFKVDLFLRDRRKRGVGKFYSPKEAVQRTPQPGDPRPPALENLLAGGEEYAVQCLDGKNDLDPQAIITFADARLHLRNGDRLSRLGPGDKMYLCSKPVGTAALMLDFRSAYLTIKEITQPSANETLVSFEEEEGMKAYLGGNTLNLTEVEMQTYRGGWLPEGIRVQMKIKDQRSEEIRTITRIFQLLRA